MYFVEETPLLEGAAKRQKDRDAGQVSMFDMFADDADSGFQEDVPAPTAWNGTSAPSSPTRRRS